VREFSTDIKNLSYEIENDKSDKSFEIQLKTSMKVKGQKFPSRCMRKMMKKSTRSNKFRKKMNKIYSKHKIENKTKKGDLLPTRRAEVMNFHKLIDEERENMKNMRHKIKNLNNRKLMFDK